MERIEEFQNQLRSLIVEAFEAGIDVEQHWACRTEADGPDWDVQIVRVK